MRPHLGFPSRIPILGGRRAWLRYAWWTFVRRYNGEICQDCGRPYFNTIYLVPDSVWSSAADPQNLLCPACLSRRVDRQGRTLWWCATTDHAALKAMASK